MTEARVRAFVAVPLPDQAKRYLQQVQQGLRDAAGDGDVKWVGPEGMHITLKFLGAMAVQQITPIAEALQRATTGITPLEIALSTLGAFPSLQRPRVVWVGATGAVDSLVMLFERVDKGLSVMGFPPEIRPFAAHITLGRVRERISPAALSRLEWALQRNSCLEGAPAVHVERIILYQSTLTPRGAVYAPLATSLLNEGPSLARSTG